MNSMTAEQQVDLFAPFTGDTILEVRSGKLKKYKGLNIESGIDKSLLDGPIHVGKLGIDGDEHDLTFHGGPDKAVHGCKSAAQARYFAFSWSPGPVGLGPGHVNIAPKRLVTHRYTYMPTHSTRLLHSHITRDPADLVHATRLLQPLPNMAVGVLISSAAVRARGLRRELCHATYERTQCVHW